MTVVDYCLFVGLFGFNCFQLGACAARKQFLAVCFFAVFAVAQLWLLILQYKEGSRKK